MSTQTPYDYYRQLVSHLDYTIRTRTDSFLKKHLESSIRITVFIPEGTIRKHVIGTTSKRMSCQLEFASAIGLLAVGSNGVTEKSQGELPPAAVRVIYEQFCTEA